MDQRLLPALPCQVCRFGVVVGGPATAEHLAAGAENLELHAIVPDDEAVLRDWRIVNEILPDRDWEADIYPNEREVVMINDDREVQRWKQ